MIIQRTQLIERTLQAQISKPPSLWVRAPGRVELMGSHTDYNDGYVLTMATDRDTWIAAEPRIDNRVRITSLNQNETHEFSFEDVPLQGHWTSYIHGVLWIMLVAEHEFPGFDAVVHGNIPLGSGLSSSASLTVATAMLACELGKCLLDDLPIAQYCRQAENDIVGVPCGILDQYSSVFGKADNAMMLDCRSLTHEHFEIPPGLQIIVCDTGAPRQLVDSAYAERRADCEQAVEILLGDPRQHALRDLSQSQFERCKSQLPDRIRLRTSYVIQENQRVLDLANAFENSDFQTIGQLCAASFHGADTQYEIVTDEMRAMRDAAAAAPGSVGVRNSGGGFGGSLVAFVQTEHADAFIQYTAETYHAATGIQPDLFCVEAANGASVL